MVSPEALKLNELLRNAPKAVDMDLLHQREAGEHAEDMTSERPRPACSAWQASTSKVRTRATRLPHPYMPTYLVYRPSWWS